MSSISDFLKGASNKVSAASKSIGDIWDNLTGGDVAVTKPSTATRGQPRAVKATTVAKTQQVLQRADRVSESEWNFSDFARNSKTIIESISSAVGSGAKAYSDVTSAISGIKTGRELDKIKNQAIVTAAREAPTALQAGLPSLSDWFSDRGAATNSTIPAVLAGSGAVGVGVNVIAVAALGVAAFMLLKK